MQQQSVLVIDVKDAFLTVPQKDFFLVKIPNWAKTDEMRSNGINFGKLLRPLPGQRNTASNLHEHFESTLSQFDFIPFEGTVYKRKTKCRCVTVHVDDVLVVGSKEDCNWFETELSKTSL